MSWRSKGKYTLFFCLKTEFTQKNLRYLWGIFQGPDSTEVRASIGFDLGNSHDLSEAVTLSDRVLVMSQRPGTIIDEIVIDLPHRDDPIARRADPKVNAYVAQLMDRLDIAHASLEQQPAGGAA